MSASKTSAKDNIWYCLMTLHNFETVKTKDQGKRNRIAWNRIAFSQFNSTPLGSSIKKALPAEEMSPLSAQEIEDYEQMLFRRSNFRFQKLPTIPDEISLRNVFFDEFFMMYGYLFPVPIFFNDSHFSRGVNFVSATFCETTSFEKCHFSEGVSFSLSEFKKDAIFESACFFGPGKFKNAEFEAAVNLRGAIFQDEADFSSSTFAKNVNFELASVGKNISFKKCIFKGKLSLSEAKFFGQTNFTNVKCENDAKFHKSFFHDFADFNNTNFGDYVGFKSCEFLQRANFRKCKFVGFSDYQSSIFHNRAQFEQSEFQSSAVFKNTKFKEVATFGNTTFYESVDMSYCHFESISYFQNAKFNGLTKFVSCNFSFLPPDFRGATLHEATEWHESNWPSTWKNRRQSQQQVYAYERLKQEMERLKKHEDEQFFYTEELRTRRAIVSPTNGYWWLNFLYEKLSGYGQSVSRPLLAQLVILLLGDMIFESTNSFKGAPLEPQRAIALSFANVFSFLPIRKEVFGEQFLKDLSPLAHLTSTVQMIVSLILFFLIGLALRNRFRMK
jgi:hypothetical protein